MPRLFRYWTPSLGSAYMESPPPYPETGELRITQDDLDDLVTMSKDMVVAFAMAGYEIPAIELVVPDYPKLGSNQNFSRNTIRIGFAQNPFSVEINPRPSSAYSLDGPSGLNAMLRVYLEPLEVDGVSKAIPIETAAIDAYLAQLGDHVTEPMTAFLTRRGITKTGVGSKTTVGQIFEENISRLSQASTGQVTFGTFLDTSRVFADGEVLKNELFVALFRLIVVPVTMFLSRLVGDAAAAWWSEPRDGGLELAPGGLWILDPATWADGPLLLDAPAPPFPQKSASRIADYLRDTIARVHESLWQPATVDLSTPGVYALGLSYIDYQESDALAALPAPAPPLAWPSVLIQRLIYNCRGEVIVRQSKDGTPIEEPELERDGGGDLATTLEMLRHVVRGTSFPAPKLRARRFRKRLEAAYRACGLSAEDAEREAAGTDFHSPLLLTIFELFANGVFANGVSTSASEDEDVEYDVLAYAEGGMIRLTLPGYTHYGIELRLLNATLGYDLVRGVCWEYVPRMPLPSDRSMAEARRGLDPNWDKPRLLIAAAPGVQITKKEWPEGSVPVEIYRVQDVELVPLHGERISPEVLTAPRALTLDDIADDAAIEAIDGLGSVAVAARANAAQPVVAIKHVREETVQGVELSYQGNDAGRWPGWGGAQTVKILVDETSGEHRFAYEVTPTVRQATRVVDWEAAETRGTRAQPKYANVDVLQYRLVVYSTPGVKVHVEANVLSESAFKDYYYIGSDLANIPPQGAPLLFMPGDNQGPVRPTWMESDGTGEFRQVSARADLTWNSQPLDDLTARFAGDVATTIVDIAIGLIPVVGDATDAAELLLSFYTGTDKWGRPITNFDRALLAGGIMIPFVSGATLKGLKAAAIASETGTRMDWLAVIDATD